MQQVAPNLSFWEKDSFLNRSDYLIIGSGIVGLNTAIHLIERRPGKKVTVLERGILPSGASTKNAGFACIGSPSELLADLGKQSEDEVFKTVEKRWRGLKQLRSLLGDENIGFQKLGSNELFDSVNLASYKECADKLNFLNEHLKSITGLSDVFGLNENIIQESGFKVFEKAISHKAEGQIDTGKMMKSLLKLAIEKGVNIINGVEVRAIEDKVAYTNLGKISFENCAICTNGFASSLMGDIDLKPARAQVIITKPIEKLNFKGIFHFDEGYYYFRNVENRVLFGGGRNLNIEGETTDDISNTEQIIGNLTEILKERICPNLKVEVDYSWAGIMGVGKSKIPIVKKIKEGIYCGVRLGGMGIAIGSLVGVELADLMINDG